MKVFCLLLAATLFTATGASAHSPLTAPAAPGQPASRLAPVPDGQPADVFGARTAEYEYLRVNVEAEQLKLYTLLRTAHEYQVRLHAPKPLMVKAMKNFIANSQGFAPGTGHVIRNLAEFKAAYRRYCPAGAKWWATPAAYFDAAAPAASVPYPVLQTINHHRAEFRQQYQPGPADASNRADQPAATLWQ